MAKNSLRNSKRRSNKRSSRRKSRTIRRKQRGGSTTMPLQYFNSSIRGNYYAEGSDMLTKQYQSAYGAINAVNTTQPNACMSQMGPNLAPFNSYSGYSGMQTGGSKRSRRNRKRSSRNKSK